MSKRASTCPALTDCRLVDRLQRPRDRKPAGECAGLDDRDVHRSEFQRRGRVRRRRGGALAHAHGASRDQPADHRNRNQGADRAAPRKPASHEQYLSLVSRSTGSRQLLAALHRPLDAPATAAGFKTCGRV